eukprot:TRINITY_DN2855_c0_g2_i1.p1 TRINITY_DN2855_c0_g2~~TRINITY_DN2855_c0_g2_i1.p1  ORF type:complete len:313 (-),score=70.19 TRINITY_DN2855_c0_g2_i1:370-1308(-)
MAACMSVATNQPPLSKGYLSKTSQLNMKAPSRALATVSVHYSKPFLRHLELCIRSSSSNLGLGFRSRRRWVTAFAHDSAVATNATEETLEEGSEELTESTEEEGFAGSLDGETASSSDQISASPFRDNRLYVGNIPFDKGGEALTKLFQEVGVVEAAEVIYDKYSGKSRGFGFVTLSTAEEADEAINRFNGYQLDGRALRVNRPEVPRGTKRPSPSYGVDSPFRVFVGNLPWSADPEGLREIFSRCGTVVGAKVLYDRETGRSRGFGFVSFSSQEEVDAAISEMNGVEMGGRPIRVNSRRSSESPAEVTEEA